MVRTLEMFWKGFSFPGFTEFFLHIIRNFLTCLQLKKTSSRYQTPPLQPLSSLQSFRGDMMQTDTFGPFRSPVSVQRCILKVLPLTNVSADTVAWELTKTLFMQSCIPNRILSDFGMTFT